MTIRLDSLEFGRIKICQMSERPDWRSWVPFAPVGSIPTLRPARRTHTAAEVLEHFDELAGAGDHSWSGRVMMLRNHGKAIFADIEDGSGHIQIYIKKDAVGEAAFKKIKLLDIGDFIEASGTLFTTRTGEKTLHVDRFTLLAKSLRQLASQGRGRRVEALRYRDAISQALSRPDRQPRDRGADLRGAGTRALRPCASS